MYEYTGIRLFKHIFLLHAWNSGQIHDVERLFTRSEYWTPKTTLLNQLFIMEWNELKNYY